MPQVSILDLAPVPENGTVADSLQSAVRIAQHAEKWGYHRYWMAEHHNMTGIASAATAVVLGHIASQTRTIRVGSAGIMLPNHPPYIVAEQFGTLDALYPNRIDLGLGRAPGTDGKTLRALRRSPNDAEQFPNDVQELLGYLAEADNADAIKAIPGFQQNIPVWLLGSSTFGAQLAARLGLPYAFASHFAPDHLSHALTLYRKQFKPSKYLDKPYAAAALNLFAADSDTHARRMMTSMQQQFISLRRGMPGRMQPPVDDIQAIADPYELAAANHALNFTAVGTKDTVARHLNQFIEQTQVDEVILTCNAYDTDDRLRSFEIGSEILLS